MQSCSLITLCKFSQPCFCHWTASSAGAGHFSSSDPSQSTGGGGEPSAEEYPGPDTILVSQYRSQSWAIMRSFISRQKGSTCKTKLNH